jgi:hypothetical protein
MTTECLVYDELSEEEVSQEGREYQEDQNKKISSLIFLIFSSFL